MLSECDLLRTSALMGAVRLSIVAATMLATGSNSASAQCETAKLVASPTGEPNAFGVVAIDGDLAAIGNRQGHGAYSAWPGSVHLYRLIEGQWTEEAVVHSIGPDKDDGFGTPVALSGDVLVVGASDQDDPVFNCGAAYVFRRIEGEWVMEAKLIASDADGNAQFGWSVSIDGDVILVGAQGDRPFGHYYGGSAYVFRYLDGHWVEEAKLIDPEGEEYDVFGSDVALIGNTALIGAPGNQDEGLGRGAAFVFRFDGEEWNLESQLGPEDDGLIWFGWSLALNDDANLAFIGAPQFDGQKGAVFVLRYDEDQWLKEATLVAGDPSGTTPWLGTCVATNRQGDAVLSGAIDDWVPYGHSGSTHLFHSADRQWTETAKIIPDDAYSAQQFGGSVAIEADTAFIGAPGPSELAGAVYVYRGVEDVDCNDNGEPDGCDIFEGMSKDLNGNGVPDECECLCDITGDGAVGVEDILAVFAVWGAVGGIEDVTFDGVVNVHDLLAILASWGPCG